MSKAKLSAEQTNSECQRLTAECQRLNERLTEQQCQSQKLHDQMLRVSRKCKTDEQVGIKSASYIMLVFQPAVVMVWMCRVLNHTQ